MAADLGEVQLCFETGSKIQSTNSRGTEPDPYPLAISQHFQCGLGHTHTRVHTCSKHHSSNLAEKKSRKTEVHGFLSSLALNFVCYRWG